MSENKKQINSYLNELPAVNPPYADTSYMVSVDRGGVAKIPISYFLNNSGSGSGESGSNSTSGLPYITVTWQNPTTTISAITEAMEAIGATTTSVKTVIQLKGYGSALILCQAVKNAASLWNVYATNLYNCKLFEAIGVDANTLTISDFLRENGDYMVAEGEGGDPISSVGDVYGLKSYSLTFADGESNHYMSEVKELIENNGGDITKLNYVFLRGIELFIRLIYVGGNYQVYAFDIFNLKTYDGQIDLATTTVADFFAYLSAAEDDSTDSSIVKVGVIPDKITSLAGIREAITSAGKTYTEPTLVQLQGPFNDNLLLIWFVSNSGDYAYAYCWELKEGKFYRTDNPVLLPTVSIGDFLSATYEVSLGSVDSSSGGSSNVNVFTDVLELPTEHINTNTIYRLWQITKAKWVLNGELVTDGGMNCKVVDTLPEVGEVCYTGTSMCAYYQRNDNALYGYVDENLSAMMSVPAGWYPAETLFTALGYTFNGYVSDLKSASSQGYYLLMTSEPSLYIYSQLTQDYIKYKIPTCMTPITYDELKALRDSGSLVAGMFYRITDYQCTTAQENTGAMNNQFDIIVQAINESTLSETASADLHEGDTYFANTNFGAWELKYCLDNDSSRFAWASDKKYSLTMRTSFKYFNAGDVLERRGSMDEYEPVEGYPYAWTKVEYMGYADITKHLYTDTAEITAETKIACYTTQEYWTHGLMLTDVCDIVCAEGKGVVYYMKDEFGNECPYDFKNITYRGGSLYDYMSAGFEADIYYPTFTNISTLTYSQWGSEWGVRRNSSIDTTIDGVTYYGYSCSATPTAWSSPDFYVTDVEIAPSSNMYIISEGIVSPLSYGGSLTVNNFENSTNVKNNVIYGKIETWSGQRSLPFIVFIGETCNYNTIQHGTNFVFEGNEGVTISAPGVNSLIFTNQISHIMILAPNLSSTRVSADLYGIPSISDKIVYDGKYVSTIKALFDKLETQGYIDYAPMILNTNMGNFIGWVAKWIDVDQYEFYLTRIGDLVAFVGTVTDPDTPLNDFLTDESPYKIDPMAKIAALEARIAALEGN